MIFMDELFREMKIRGHLEELKQSPDLSSRIELLNKILDRMEEERLAFYSPDEQLYLLSRIQEKGDRYGNLPLLLYLLFKEKPKISLLLSSSYTYRKTTDLLPRIEK